MMPRSAVACGTVTHIADRRRGDATGIDAARRLHPATRHECERLDAISTVARLGRVLSAWQHVDGDPVGLLAAIRDAVR